LKITLRSSTLARRDCHRRLRRRQPRIDTVSTNYNKEWVAAPNQHFSFFDLVN